MSFAFQERTRAFDLRNALFLAEIAEAVYEPAEKLERLARSDWDFTNFSFIDANDTQCLVANNGRMSVVAFRGTETKLSDWHTDAHVELVPGPLGGKVHAGFYDALGHVWREIEQQLDRFDPQQQTPLWVTGHSLGGALGVLAVSRGSIPAERLRGSILLDSPAPATAPSPATSILPSNRSRFGLSTTMIWSPVRRRNSLATAIREHSNT